MSRDLHLWGLYNLTKRYCLSDKFIMWADTKNVKDIEEQKNILAILKPHMKADWTPDININHLFKWQTLKQQLSLN